MIAKTPPTPVAVATRLARNGSATWPSRLPVMRSDMTVPMAAADAMSTTLVRLKVVAIPSANPRNVIAAYMPGSGIGRAKQTKRRVAATRSGAAHAQHLLTRHEEQLADAEQSGEQKERGERIGKKAKPGAGDDEHA
jgi:hypothetical protein